MILYAGLFGEKSKHKNLRIPYNAKSNCKLRTNKWVTGD